MQIIPNFLKNRAGTPSTEQPKEKSMLGGFLDLGIRKLSGEKAISSKLIESYMSWVYINSSVLAEEISKLELKLYQTQYKNGELELAEVESHELLDLLDRFNDSNTSSDAYYLTESHLNLTGDSFWYLANQVGGKPSEIFLLRPDKMTVKLGDVTDSSRRLIEGYNYKDVVDGKVVEIDYAPEDILQFKVPNPANPYRGKSTVEAVANDIDIDNYAGATLREFFENGMIIQFALSTDQRLNNDQIKNFQSQLRSAYGGAKNAWKVPIFGGGVKPVELQMSSKDMELVAQMQWLRDKIMLAFKNTPASLGIVEDVNRANAEASLLSWKQSVIEPKMKRIVDTLNEFLVPRYGDNLVLGFESPVPEDDAADIKKAIELYKGGLITKNEARALIEYDDVTGGDDFTSSGFQAVPTPEDLPKALKNVNWKKAFRQQGIFGRYSEYKKFYNEALPMARKSLTKPLKIAEKEVPKRIYSFDYDKVQKYADNVLKIVDHNEGKFQNAVEQILASMIELAIGRIDDPEYRKKHELVDKQYWIRESVNKLSPILDEVAITAGNQAYNLIGVDKPYIPKAMNEQTIREFIRSNIELFMGSAIDTDIDTMVEIIASGLEAEASIPTIRREIQDKFFGDGKAARIQAEKITRTEVIKTSNAGAEDAFIESGVVEGKEWLATDDDRTDADCLEMDGQIVELGSSYDDTIIDKLGDKADRILSYSSVEYPPLHTNCRCVLIPVIVDSKALDRSAQNKALKEKIIELETQVDKRTKEFKQLKAEHTDDKAYIKALEKFAGVEDGQE